MKEKSPQIYSANLVVRNGKMVFRHAKEKELFETFQSELAEGQSVEMHYTAAVEEGTLTMLARIHACIRTLADETGITSQEMKDQIKRRGGYITNGELESFKDMSLKKLQAVFQTVCEVGDFLGTNVR